MKKIISGVAILFVIAASTQRIQAQVRVGLNVNIGSQPVWGPAGYNYAQYYYLPDIDVYYSVPRHQFIYLSDGQWVFSANLPSRYHGYNLYSGYKVVLNEPRPYLHDVRYRERYARYRGRHDQVIIRNSHDARYHHGWRKHEDRRRHEHDRH